MSWMSLGGSSFENGNNVSHRQLIPHCSPSLVQGKNNACHFFRSHISRYDVFKIKSCSIYQRRNKREKKCPPKTVIPVCPKGTAALPPQISGEGLLQLWGLSVCVCLLYVCGGRKRRVVSTDAVQVLPPPPPRGFLPSKGR